MNPFTQFSQAERILLMALNILELEQLGIKTDITSITFQTDSECQFNFQTFQHHEFINLEDSHESSLLQQVLQGLRDNS